MLKKSKKMEEAYRKLLDAYAEMGLAYADCKKALEGNELQKKYYSQHSKIEAAIAEKLANESFDIYKKLK